MSRHDKKLIKLADLQALVLEELERHLMLDASRLKTFAEARLEVVTYVEAKTGLRRSRWKTPRGYPMCRGPKRPSKGKNSRPGLAGLDTEKQIRIETVQEEPED